MMREDVEAIYPLSPLQQGLLFHHLYERRAGEYFEQFSCTLAGPLDPAAFAGAWARVMARHGVLRTAFVWDGLERPMQVVHHGLGLPLAVLDWRDAPAASRPARLAALLEQDRERGFDLLVAPLMRILLIRLEDELHELVWSHHH